MSQGSNPPLSQETFNHLWSQINSVTEQGALTQAVTQPLDYEFSEADTGQNRIDFEVKSYQLKAMDSFDLMTSQLSGLSQLPSLPNMTSSFLNALGGGDPTDQPSTSTGLTSGLTTYTATPSNVPTTSPGVAPGAPSNCATPGSPYSASSEQNMTPPPAYPVQSPVGQIPSNTDYPGPLGFEISFGPQQTNTAKSATWTYSEVLNKLYVRMALTCPVKFKTRTAVPLGSYIRAMPLYKKPEHVTEVVRRCHNHTAAKEFNDHPAPSHLIRVEGNPHAQYWEDQQTQRQSVTVHYDSPQAGTEYNTVLFNFMCFSSCVGGLNRRPVQVIFTLENTQGQVLGRRVVEVRICACPGRDRKTEEKTYFKAHGHQPTESTTPVKNKKGVKRMSQGFTITTLGSKKRKTHDDNIYYVPVRGRENYEILMRIKESLELMQMIPKAQVEQYRATQANLSKIPSLHTALNRSESFSNTPVQPDHAHGSQLNHSGESHSSTDTVSPHNGHPPADGEGTVADWLTKLGCASCIEIFHRRKINFVSQLEEINLQDLHEMKLTERLVDKIWKGIIDYKAAKDFSDTPSLLRRSSTASTVDLNHLTGSSGALPPGGVVEATRFTLKQTISLDDIKVKQEKVEEEEEEWDEEEVGEMGFNQQNDHDYV